ncbi:RDD family protein [Actinoplanes sp. NPDC049548]|uniref:RDD family protein n=1 Tax=Actinoplanes sp. NPDC049548 TaxID=3155152 RepID=UPI003443417F
MPPPGYPPYYGPPPQYGPPGWPAQPVPLSPDGRPLADFGSRFLAYLIDIAILTAVSMVVFVPVMLWFTFRMFDMAALTDPYADPVAVQEQMFRDFVVPFLLMELGLVVFLLIAYYIYYVEMMFRTGQTLGKKLIKVRVVPIEPGATLTRGMAAKRYLIEFVGGVLVPFFSYLDGLWQLWDKPYQQTLHDKVAKTVVVKVAP